MPIGATIITAVYQGAVQDEGVSQDQLEVFAASSRVPTRAARTYHGLFCLGSEVLEVYRTASGIPELRHRSCHEPGYICYAMGGTVGCPGFAPESAGCAYTRPR